MARLSTSEALIVNRLLLGDRAPQIAGMNFVGQSTVQTPTGGRIPPS